MSMNPPDASKGDLRLLISDSARIVQICTYAGGYPHRTEWVDLPALNVLEGHAGHVSCTFQVSSVHIIRSSDAEDRE